MVLLYCLSSQKFHPTKFLSGSTSDGIHWNTQILMYCNEEYCTIYNIRHLVVSMHCNVYCNIHIHSINNDRSFWSTNPFRFTVRIALNGVQHSLYANPVPTCLWVPLVGVLQLNYWFVHLTTKFANVMRGFQDNLGQAIVKESRDGRMGRI